MGTTAFVLFTERFWPVRNCFYCGIFSSHVDNAVSFLAPECFILLLLGESVSWHATTQRKHCMDGVESKI